MSSYGTDFYDNIYYIITVVIIVTSVNEVGEVMFLPMFVCMSLCLFLCLFACL